MVEDKNIQSKFSPEVSQDGISQSEVSQDESLLKELLTQAKDTLDGRSLQEKIATVLNLRIELEVRMLKLIDGGLLHSDGTISDKAVALHKAAKDSISELVKVYRLLCDLSTENINLCTEEEKEELDNLRKEIYGRG